MKFKNILVLAFKNILQKRSAYIKAFVSFFLVFLFTNLVMFYSNSLTRTYSDYELKYIDNARYIVCSKISAEEESEIRKFNQVSSITFEYFLEFNYKENTYVKIDDNEFTVNAGKYFSGTLIDTRSDYTVSENIIKAHEVSNEKLIICGTDLKNKDDILLSENVLSWFNIPVDEELLGKYIEIRNSDYFIKGKLCGILNGEIFDLESFRGYLGEGEDYNTVDISLKSFFGNDDFFEKMNQMFGEEPTHYFRGNSELENMQIINGQQILCSKFLSLICVIIAAICFVYVTCNQFYLLQKNSAYYGVLKAGGVSNREVFAIHMFELVMLCVVALIIAFAASIGIFFILQTVFAEVLYIDLVFSFGVSIGYFFAFVLGSILFSFVITLFIYIKILSKPTIYLFKN